MATTTGGLPYPVGTDLVKDGDNAIKALADALDLHAAKPLGSAVMTAATLPAGGGTLGLCSSPLTVAAVAWPRLVAVTLSVTAASQTTWVTYTIRVGGTGMTGRRSATPQQTIDFVYWDLVPANTARSYDATVNSTAAVATLAAPVSFLSAVAFPAAP
jgi:hypothetical protein